MTLSRRIVENSNIRVPKMRIVRDETFSVDKMLRFECSRRDVTFFSSFFFSLFLFLISFSRYSFKYQFYTSIFIPFGSPLRSAVLIMTSIFAYLHSKTRRFILFGVIFAQLEKHFKIFRFIMKIIHLNA